VSNRMEIEHGIVQRLDELFLEYDSNNTGDLSREEFCELTHDHVGLLTQLDIDVSDKDGLFSLLDTNKTNVLEHDQFVLGCLTLRGMARRTTVMNMHATHEVLLQQLAEVRSLVTINSEVLASSDQFKEQFHSALLRHRQGQEPRRSASERPTLRKGHKRSRSQSIQDPHERAMTLVELRDVRRVVKDNYQDWVDVVTGHPVEPEDVTLTILNYFHISPETVMYHCFLKGLRGPMQVGQMLNQWYPLSWRHYHCPMAKGKVEEVLPDGSVKVTLLFGRFESERVAGDAHVTAHLVDAEGNEEEVSTECGIPSEVDSPGAVSYKELVSSQATKPKWYTCHWWGESVLDFVECCESHAALRQVEEPSYWICGYANRQHFLEEDINVQDLCNTSFYKAMRLADGVLLILDPQATPFKRMWCGFEIYIATTTGTKLDVATFHGHAHDPYSEASFLIDGMLPNEPQRAKIVRERRFPHSLLLAGVMELLEEGSCYLPTDKKRILNFMGNDGVGPDEDARVASALRKANSMLHGRFAVAAWPFAIEHNLVTNFGIHAAGAHISLVGSLRNDTARTCLKLSVAHCQGVSNLDLQDIADGLPPNLVDLDVSFEGCIEISNVGLESFVGKLPRSLRAIRFCIRGCREVTDEGIVVLAQQLGSLQDLEEVTLDCGMCHSLSDNSLGVLAEHLQQVQNKRCAVWFRGTQVNRNFNSFKELSNAARSPSRLFVVGA